MVTACLNDLSECGCARGEVYITYCLLAAFSFSGSCLLLLLPGVAVCRHCATNARSAGQRIQSAAEKFDEGAGGDRNSPVRARRMLPTATLPFGAAQPAAAAPVGADPVQRCLVAEK